MDNVKELTAEQARLKIFAKGLVNEFQDFVSDSIEESLHENFEDHFDFIEACMSIFIEMKRDQEMESK